ncbi:dihydrodipicolinate synthetase [Candidatus Vecturithrix granuli]|uniref:Dihydrodipicolinate synthetase n=1 Tax=Vecturithrix granuli TaxID=1499967 RepID=A0A081C0E3_VECG1|nr:dihydrodipicolinate synthetase [Candidatus Vecturithrix granuli]
MKIQGVIAAMVTPYADEQCTISQERIKKLCGFLLSKGISGLLPLGTTGEGPYLSKEQRKEVAETVVKHANKRIPVIVHTGMLTTVDTVELSLHAQDIGADAIAVMTPFFRHLEDNALFDFFTIVAKEVAPLPMFLYNLPAMTNNDISPALLFRLATQADNIIGLKYSSNDLLRFREYRKKMGADFQLFIGSDEMILPALFEGANGCVSGPASCYPEVITGIYNAFVQGDFQEAARQQALLDELRAIFKDGTLLCYFKAILQLRGIETGQVKPPLRNITTEEFDVLECDLRRLRLL